MNEKKKTARVILHYDVWDHDGNRLPAAPITGLNAVNAPIRKQVTELEVTLAESLVEDGKAQWAKAD